MKTYEVQNDTSKTEKHTPMIWAPSVVKPNEPFEVTVQVGADIPHPNTVEHHIKWIQVYFYEDGRAFNPIHVGTFDLGPVYAEPKVTFRMKLSKGGKLVALEYCNIHGVWENEVAISVSEQEV
ncbi:desulfoferrodoxin [Coprothermobacteraceae bacterium]|nr:desulfoferrodoxin [Coprothermobacteraceae bacterium]